METTQMGTNVNEQAIRWLQFMLNELAIHDSALPRLVVTGVFDEPTLEAVMIFQRDYFPPVTGVVNNATWDAVTAAYEQDQRLHGVPSQLRALPNGAFQTKEGEFSQQIRLAQAMLTAMGSTLSNFNCNDSDGMNTGETLNSLRQLQRLAKLQETGTLDRLTWEYLSRLYHIFVTRGGLLQAT